MKTQLRPYQVESIDAAFLHWQAGGGDPLIEMATGLGKSIVVAEILRRVHTTWPDMRSVMCVHVQELVEQNFSALHRLWPGAPAGIYSAGLGRREVGSRIICASIQSVYKKANVLGPRDLMIVDEAHLIPHKGEGMYQKFISDLRKQVPDMRILGLTATPYRLDSGRLDQGDDRIFSETIYRYGVGEGIEDGWLSPITARASRTEIDVSDVGKRGGEFIAGALEAAADQDELTKAAVEDMLRLAGERKSWLVFCCGVKHAANVAAALREKGINAAHVTGDTPKDERRRLIADFKSGKLRALTNAQVLTTGFDAPGTDMIAFLRPTLSTGLYIQMVGRGTRKAEGKENCLILDFAGNVRRHGPVDAVRGRDRKEKKPGEEDEIEVKVKADDVRAKECDACGTLNAVSAIACAMCGTPFPARAPNHEKAADTNVALLSKDIVAPTGADVYDWAWSRHKKAGSPDSVRVTYFAGVMQHSEWLAFEHDGFAKSKAAEWWRKHGGALPVPRTVEEALNRYRGELTRPATIYVERQPVPNEKFWRVKGRTFAQPVVQSTVIFDAQADSETRLAKYRESA